MLDCWPKVSLFTKAMTSIFLCRLTAYHSYSHVVLSAPDVSKYFRAIIMKYFRANLTRYFCSAKQAKRNLARIVKHAGGIVLLHFTLSCCIGQWNVLLHDTLLLHRTDRTQDVTQLTLNRCEDCEGSIPSVLCGVSCPIPSVSALSRPSCHIPGPSLIKENTHRVRPCWISNTQVGESVFISGFYLNIPTFPSESEIDNILNSW